MIELNFTVIFQLVIVLILVVILGNLVFKPFLKVLQERKDWVEGSEKKARELQQRAEDLMEKHRDTMAAAQAEGATIREEIRKVSMAQETEILQKAMDEGSRFLGEMKTKIQEETQKARVSLRIHAQNLSRELAEKMLGRSVQ